jgi:hypothetical protein
MDNTYSNCTKISRFHARTARERDLLDPGIGTARAEENTKEPKRTFVAEVFHEGNRPIFLKYTFEEVRLRV